MKRRLLWLVVVAVTISSVYGIRYVRARQAMGHIVPVDKRIVDANNDFACRLFKTIALSQPERNTLISPVGVSMTLALAYNGAVGDTQKAMAKSLGLDGISIDEVNKANSALLANLENPGKGVELALANGVWVGKVAPIMPDFAGTAREFYAAESRNIDFADSRSASEINNWVREKTHGRIGEITEGLDGNSLVCLTNAVYFNGRWTHEFDKAETSDAPFFITNDKFTTVPMMHQKRNFRYCENRDFCAAALPYGSKRMSMYIFVPERWSSLPAFLQQLSAKNLNVWITRFHQTKVDVKVPKWKLECQTDLRQACGKLGMEIAFNDGKANFDGMCRCGKDKAYIDVLEQKAFIEVNEKGTEAAAATYELLKARSGCPQLHANRPFFYTIRDDMTGEILFMGTVVEP